MDITELSVDGYEKVVRCRDKDSGLHALIAVHDTTLGPALGGMRMLPYASEDEALIDVLRLSRGMTYKSAVADTGLGGGKSVIIGDPAIKPEALFLAMGRFVDSLGGSGGSPALPARRGAPVIPVPTQPMAVWSASKRLCKKPLDLLTAKGARS